MSGQCAYIVSISRAIQYHYHCVDTYTGGVLVPVSISMFGH